MPTGGRDLEAFRAYVTWFERGQEFTVRSGPRPATDEAFRPASEFTERYPTLTRLLVRARVTQFDVRDQRYHLYCWTVGSGDTIGWLCVPPVRTVHKTWLHPDHKLLLRYFGGIVEPWGQTEDWTWLANYRNVLTEDTCTIGVGWEDSYRLACELDGMPAVINPTEYAAFAFEGNGDLTAYQLHSGRVVMFAHDHAFDHIDVLEGCPDYTFYTIRDCPDFRTWVEAVARQWLKLLEQPSEA